MLGERDEGRLIVEEDKGEEERGDQQRSNQFLLKSFFLFSYRKNNLKIVLDSRGWTLIPVGPLQLGIFWENRTPTCTLSSALAHCDVV